MIKSNMRISVFICVFIIFCLLVVPNFTAQDVQFVDQSMNYIFIKVEIDREFYANETIIIQLFGYVVRQHKTTREKFLMDAIWQKKNKFGAYDNIKKFHKTLIPSINNDLKIGQFPPGMYRLVINARSLPENNDDIVYSDETDVPIPIKLKPIQYTAHNLGNEEFYVRIDEDNQTLSVEMWIYDGKTVFLHRGWSNITERYFKLPEEAIVVSFFVIDSNGWVNHWNGEKPYTIAVQEIEPWASQSVWAWILFIFLSLVAVIVGVVIYNKCRDVFQ